MFFAGQRYGIPIEVCTCVAREVAGRRQARQWFGCTSPAHWVALAPTRFALRALDECAELFGPAGGCCAAVRPGRFGARRARSASAPQSGALRKFWAHGALGEPKSPRRTGPKCSTGKTKVVEHIEKIRMVSVPQRAPHHNRHNRVFHIEGPPGTLMTTPLDTPVDVPGAYFHPCDRKPATPRPCPPVTHYNLKIGLSGG